MLWEVHEACGPKETRGGNRYNCNQTCGLHILKRKGQNGAESLRGCVQATFVIKDVEHSVKATVNQMSFF